MGPLSDQETQEVLNRVQTQIVETLEQLQLARTRVEILLARISILEAENALLREAVAIAPMVEKERILREVEKRWPAARRGA